MPQRTANSQQPTASSTGTRTRALFAVTCSLFAVFFTGCHSLPPATPLDQLNAQQSSGHQVFQAHCSQCHYDRSADPLHGPGLRGILKKPYLPSGAPANDDRVANTIHHGRNLMPPQPLVDDQDTADLIAYLHTL